jgi:NAD+ diphosphatase
VTSGFRPSVRPPAEGETGYCFAIRGSAVLVRENGTAPSIPEAEAPFAEPHLYLGHIDGVHCWAVELPEDAEPPPGGSFQELRPLFGQLPEELWGIAGRALQIVDWDRTHRYCGRCGGPTDHAPGERAKRCTACGLLAPAVIVRVTRGDEILLAHGARFPARFHSVLAGFVEPGESLEEAAHRELHEEVGIEITNLRYFGSQPWPFPHSLMIGFTAEHASGELEPDPEEILEVGWYRAADIPPIPPRMSIARGLIDDWLEQQRFGL